MPHRISPPLRSPSRFREITKGRRAAANNTGERGAIEISLKRENDGETVDAATMKRDTPLSTSRPYGVAFYFVVTRGAPAS